MDFASAMETFAEAWVAANTKQEYNFNTQNEPLELTTGKTERADDIVTSPRPAPTTSPPPNQPPNFEGPDYHQVSSGRIIPLHCVVETIWDLSGGPSTLSTDLDGPLVEMDTVVKVPYLTPLRDLISVTLVTLGYSKEAAKAAKGSFMIRNWKPLPYDTIAENTKIPVGDLLADLTSFITLRIQIFRTKPDPLQDMREKLLQILLLRNHSMIAASGCPLDESLFSQLMRLGPAGGPELNDETRRKFDSWWSLQTSRYNRHPPWYSAPPPHTPSAPPAPTTTPKEAAALHPALQMVQNQHPTPKTRMRTSFDPELELPKLQQWFLENQHPSRQQIQQFVRELNSLESRRGRKPLDVNNVVYWFKNARAAQKRAEIRNLPPGLQYKLMLNGYHSNSQSPSEGGPAKSPSSVKSETLEPLLSPQTLSSPGPEKSPLPRPSSENNHPDVGEEACDNPHQMQDINDTTNNNNNNNATKEESGDMSQEEEEDEEEEYEKEYKTLLKEGVGGGGSGGGTGGPPRGGPGFPVVANSMFNHSIMYMSHYFPGLSPASASLAAAADERRKRNRTFIDPVSEVPRLEQWFAINTHPPHALILKYTDDLNQMPYRQKFPPLEPKNVQFWFKNRRAKCKRLKTSLFDSNSYLQPPYPHHITSSLSGDSYQAH